MQQTDAKTAASNPATEVSFAGALFDSRKGGARSCRLSLGSSPSFSKIPLLIAQRLIVPDELQTVMFCRIIQPVAERLLHGEAEQTQPFHRTATFQRSLPPTLPTDQWAILPSPESARSGSAGAAYIPYYGTESSGFLKNDRLRLRRQSLGQIESRRSRLSFRATGMLCGTAFFLRGGD